VCFFKGSVIGIRYLYLRIAILLLFQIIGMVGLIDGVRWSWYCIGSIAIQVYFWGWLLDGFLCL
jgi:hypothetical protein